MTLNRKTNSATASFLSSQTIDIVKKRTVTPNDYNRKSRLAKTIMFSSSLDGDGDDLNNNENSPDNAFHLITEYPKRSILFSVLMTTCGATLGPFLDSYHSAFGVLAYDEPIRFILWGSETYPALTTAWWVPELFGLAGFLIGWLYILFDATLLNASNDERLRPTPSKTLVGISFFTLQYWLSGILLQSNTLDRTGILNLMSLLAASGFLVLDGTFSGLTVSLITCIGGPLIEAGLITATSSGLMSGGYHYTDLGETGFFPLWIVPIYFLGGPANGNLARGFWNALSGKRGGGEMVAVNEPCEVCHSTRRTPCPNCDGVGTYVAMGNRIVQCTSCNSRGYVICRACFDQFDDDPHDIDGIRDIMNRMPDYYEFRNN
ncbi:unnamed protein product [Pseudo-nitzschia multistriata]|uniref:Uncharacterized protein n=1 Tax=Pseudo-nitzschia multistriata TaxID=183589 RepID=A0A448ZEC3_9STRA|nr:unnamed protein product [Pseudo-nitzschia multistriata]